MNTSSSDFRVYMRVENRFDLLLNAVNSIPEFWPLLTIVDNSPNGLTDFSEWNPEVSWPQRVFRPPVALNFSQSHNFFFKDAKERGAKFILWMHTDAEAINGGHLKLLNLARKYMAEGRRWHTIWTNYDSLAAVNLASIDDVGGYDVALPKYFDDNDLHRRMRMAGWELIDSGIPTKHIGSQTIKSNPIWEFVNGQTFPLYREYYIRKHGGLPGMETFDHPFNQPWMTWKDAHPQA